MYRFSVINLNVPENVFQDVCFKAVDSIRLRGGSKTNYKMDLNTKIMICNEPNKNNTAIMEYIKFNLQRKKYIEGRDYTINILIED